MPWHLGEAITAIKFRFADSQNKGDRFTAKAGGGQTLFGQPLLSKHRDTLILVEGELNCLSIWQGLRDTGKAWVDVVSFGSEKGGVSNYTMKLAQLYRGVIVWADEASVAADTVRMLGETATGVHSPQGRDANDLLGDGELGEFLVELLKKLERAYCPDWQTVSLRLPSDSPLELVPGKWRQLDTGELLATYTPSELVTALRNSRDPPREGVVAGASPKALDRTPKLLIEKLTISNHRENRILGVTN